MKDRAEVKDIDDIHDLIVSNIINKIRNKI